MKILVRCTLSKCYWTRLGEWSEREEEARQFDTIPAAVITCANWGLDDAEIVLRPADWNRMAESLDQLVYIMGGRKPLPIHPEGAPLVRVFV